MQEACGGVLTEEAGEKVGRDWGRPSMPCCKVALSADKRVSI